MSTPEPRSRLVLMVDDDEEDVYLTRRAFGSLGGTCTLRHVEDGESLFAWLDNAGDYGDRRAHPRPGLILMDINMPRVNGFEVLARLRSTDARAGIPVVMLSTSTAEADVERAYRLGANSFIGKPVRASGMQDIARRIEAFWFDTAIVP